jgi:hypothetical protein
MMQNQCEKNEMARPKGFEPLTPRFVVAFQQGASESQRHFRSS